MVLSYYCDPPIIPHFWLNTLGQMYRAFLCGLCIAFWAIFLAIVTNFFWRGGLRQSYRTFTVTLVIPRTLAVVGLRKICEIWDILRAWVGGVYFKFIVHWILVSPNYKPASVGRNIYKEKNILSHATRIELFNVMISQLNFHFYHQSKGLNQSWVETNSAIPLVSPLYVNYIF